MFTEIQAAVSEVIAENELTRRMIEALPSEKHAYRPHAKARTAGELAWHLVTSRAWFLKDGAGLAFSEGLQLHLHKPEATTAGMLEALDHLMGEELLQMRGQDDFWVKEDVEFLDRNLTRGAVLHKMLMHECHHRGQLCTYLRAMGASVPGIYGPSADDAE